MNESPENPEMGRRGVWAKLFLAAFPFLLVALFLFLDWVFRGG